MSLHRDRFRARLDARPLLADGGGGTLLFSRGIPQRSCLDELPTTRPDLVGAIHREYLEAGAELIETVTFGANRIRLEGWGLGDRAARLNRRAVQVAREARDVAGRDAWVAGSIGPLGPPTRELRHPDEATVRSVFREQIDGLLEGGVDLLVMETFVDLGHLLLAVEEARRAADLPVVASLTFGEDLVLADGTTPEAAAVALAQAGVDAVGVNCGVGPITCLDALERMGGPGAALPARSIMPNAGLSQRLEGRFVWAAEPSYFGAFVPRLLAAGARIIGGCCGTTPTHVAAMRGVLDEPQWAGDADAAAAPPTVEAVRRDGPPSAAGPGPRGAAPATEDAVRAHPAEVEPPRHAVGTPPREVDARTPAVAPTLAPAPAAAPAVAPTAGSVATAEVTAGPAEEVAPSPTLLGQALAAGRFVVSVEIDPPRSIRIDRTLEAARLLRDAGVDLVNISDSAMARVRMGAMAVAFGIQRELSLECLVHVTTRDRNLMALESELLGAHALGVRNILALTGDPPRVADYPTGSGVWDVDSIGLVEILVRLNRGEDQAGSPIGHRAGFTIACALDPTSSDPQTEWDRLERKLAAGAQLVMTQPLYDTAQVEAMLAEARRRFGSGGFPVPVLLGILPLVSSRHAEFLHHEVPGITIPSAVREAMAGAGGRASEVGLETADRLLAAVEREVSGTYLMPSFGRYEQVAELARRVRARHPTVGDPSGP